MEKEAAISYHLGHSYLLGRFEPTSSASVKCRMLESHMLSRVSLVWKNLLALSHLQRSSYALATADQMLTFFGGESPPRVPVDVDLRIVELIGGKQY